MMRFRNLLIALLAFLLVVAGLQAQGDLFYPTTGERLAVEGIVEALSRGGELEAPTRKILNESLTRLAETETLRSRFEAVFRGIEARDPEVTAPHCRRVGAMAARLFELYAQGRGWDPVKIQDRSQVLYWAAIVHDGGKASIPSAILDKPGLLDGAERVQMEGHSRAGAELFQGGKSRVETVARNVAHHHHERWDGTGYPQKRAGKAIPFSARIVAVVDVYDSLTNRRSYKEAWPMEKVLAVMEGESGRLFDPDVLRFFLQNRSEIEGAAHRVSRPVKGQVEELRSLRRDLKKGLGGHRSIMEGIRVRARALLAIGWGTSMAKVHPLPKASRLVSRPKGEERPGLFHDLAMSKKVASRRAVKASSSRVSTLRVAKARTLAKQIRGMGRR